MSENEDYGMFVPEKKMGPVQAAGLRQDAKVKAILAELAAIRTFDSGATRNVETGKPDYEGFLSPLVIERFGQYMLKHQTQADGTLRSSDNWQKGIPRDAYMKSGFRHFMEWWGGHRAGNVDEEALCAHLFNVQGYLHELLKARAAATSAATPTGPQQP
jgi:hypothetical protein